MYYAILDTLTTHIFPDTKCLCLLGNYGKQKKKSGQLDCSNQSFVDCLYRHTIRHRTYSSIPSKTVSRVHKPLSLFWPCCKTQENKQNL